MRAQVKLGRIAGISVGLHYSWFIVAVLIMIAGLITLNDVKKVPRDLWQRTSVQSVMRPLRELRTVNLDTSAIQALEMMIRDDLNQLPVLANGQLQGVFSRGQVLRFLQTATEIHSRSI